MFSTALESTAASVFRADASPSHNTVYSLAGGPKLLSNAEHRQMQGTGRVQYIAGGGGSLLFSIVAGMCIYIFKSLSQ